MSQIGEYTTCVIIFVIFVCRLMLSVPAQRKGIWSGDAGQGVTLQFDIEYEVSEKDIVDGKYILAQKGKKNYFIINVLKYGETGKHKTAQGRP